MPARTGSGNVGHASTGRRGSAILPWRLESRPHKAHRARRQDRQVRHPQSLATLAPLATSTIARMPVRDRAQKVREIFWDEGDLKSDWEWTRYTNPASRESGSGSTRPPARVDARAFTPRRDPRQPSHRGNKAGSKATGRSLDRRQHGQADRLGESRSRLLRLRPRSLRGRPRRAPGRADSLEERCCIGAPSQRRSG